jgi:acyl dehydratase/NAD(P)-dependent dehydrogenase (short-subunit alcohol dehydrogenase family)
LIGSKVFRIEDQARFAALTGDYNPMHMDPIAARRTMAGAPVVHGMHTLLWLLDKIGAGNLHIDNVATIKASFRRMVYVGDQVDANIVRHTAKLLRAQARVDGVEVVTLVIGLDPPPPASAEELPLSPLNEPPLYQGGPTDLTLEDMEQRCGRVLFASDPADMELEFPDAARVLGRDRVAALGCSTYLVGMIVPGLHSLYSGLDLRLISETISANELQFAVRSIDRRFRGVKLAIRGGGLSGFLDTFSRGAPVSQPPIFEIVKHVGPTEFEGSVALIVGGSRGLGELTAKLLAAGGSRVIITYASGKADADKLTAEINDCGGKCEAIALDVRQEPDQQLKSLNVAPTHVYYFATPTIAKRKSGLCSRARLDEFNEFYVHGFLRLVEACLRRNVDGIAVFYPSSVYVQSRPENMTEYAMSKAGGEILCRDIAQYLPKVRILSERLPRVATDQTASLMSPADSALSVILPIVRKLHLQASATEQFPAA